jgi:type VI secretion system protein ImpH
MAADDRNPAGILDLASTPAAPVARHASRADPLGLVTVELDTSDELFDEPTVQSEMPLTEELTLEQRLEPLIRAASHMGFFPLVSLLERLTADAVRVGGDGPPALEAIRFRHDPSLGFSAGDVSSASIIRVPVDLENPLGATRPVVELVTTFLGLTGGTSPLPLYIAEEVLHEDERGVRRDFLDIFHHRFVSILYRAVMRYSLAREHRANDRDLWVERVLAIAGMDPESFVPQSAIPRGKLLQLAPLVGRRGRGARDLQAALRLLLADHLTPGARLVVDEFAGGWVPVHGDQQCTVGQRNNVLGEDAMLGGKVYDRSGRFQVAIGPLDARGRDAFSLGGEGLRLLREGVRLVVKESLDYDVELRVDASAAQRFRLYSRAPSRLGQNTRLGLGHRDEVIRLRNVGRTPAEPRPPAPTHEVERA